MAESKSISQLTTAENLTLSDLLVLSVPFSESETGYISRNTSLAELSSSMLGKFEYTTSLETSNKTVFGAINEVKAQSDFFVTTTPSDIIENVLTGVNVMHFSAAVTPATVTICCRLSFDAGLETLTSGAKVFGIKSGYWPQGIVHQIVNTNAKISNNTQANKVRMENADVLYTGGITDITYIEIATTYPRKQN